MSKIPENIKDQIYSVVSFDFMGAGSVNLNKLKNHTFYPYKNVIQSPFLSVLETIKIRQNMIIMANNPKEYANELE